MSVLRILFTVLFAIVWLIALGGHLVLLKILLTPAEKVKLRLPAKSWLILFSITFSDLIALLFGLPFTALFEIFDDWYFGPLFCHLTPFVKTFAVTVSVYGILTLLLQGYELACKAHRPKTPPATFVFLVALIWLLSLVTALPLLIAPTVRAHKGPVSEDLEFLMFELDLDETETTEEKSNETLVERNACYIPYRFEMVYSYSFGFEVIVQFAAPLIMLTYLFIKTADAMDRKVVEEVKMQRSIRATNNNGEQPAQQQPQQQKPQQLQSISRSDVIFVRMVLIFSVVFYILWAPAFLCEHLLMISDIVWYIFTVISESTYFIKPFLLLALNENFRNAIRTIGVTTTDRKETKLKEEMPTTP